ncbi:MAG: ABC transporter ATP-binding protein [Ruminococcaceae bacterium]|nr:ABC transporter ATP-binding protein [Oscillospiraceae bacterium]
MNEIKFKNLFRKGDFKTIKWIYSICKSERYKVLLLIIVESISAIVTVSFAKLSKDIINAATVDKSLDLVIQHSLYFIGAILIQLVLYVLERSTTERCRCKLEWILKQHTLESVIRKDYLSVSKIHTGELQNRMFNDVSVIADGFTTILPNIVYFVVKLIAAFAYLIIIDKFFAVVFLVGGIAVFLFSHLFRGVIKRLHKAVQETEGKTRSFIQEALTSLLVVKSFVVEDKIAETSDELQSENYRVKMKRRFFSISANAGINLVFNIGFVFAVAFGAYRIIFTGLSYGDVTAMIQLVSQIQSPFASLSSVLPRYFTLLASAERLMELDELPDEFHENEGEIDVELAYSDLKRINFKDISFAYDRDIILDNTSLSIDKGDFVAIMGISGIGKSTLLKLLLGVFPVKDGSIELELDGECIPVDYTTRRMFSYVPQGNFILSGTIRENLTFINDDVTEEEINEAIRISCSDEFISTLPEGVETVIGERGVGLSEGQLQRLAIARSLLSNAPVVLLDEATSALDEATEKRFLENLKELRTKTCIIVSHKKAALDICNKHVQIIDSKIVMEEA